MALDKLEKYSIHREYYLAFETSDFETLVREFFKLVTWVATPSVRREKEGYRLDPGNMSVHDFSLVPRIIGTTDVEVIEALNSANLGYYIKINPQDKVKRKNV